MFVTNPLLPQNKPSRESIFCGKVGNWLMERALLMLNFLLETGQDGWKRLVPNWPRSQPATLPTGLTPRPSPRGEGSDVLCKTSPPNRYRPHPQPLSKEERGVMCFVRPHPLTATGLTPNPSPRGEGSDVLCKTSPLTATGLTPNPSPRGEGSDVLCKT